jgi:hypothetical protein
MRVNFILIVFTFLFIIQNYELMAQPDNSITNPDKLVVLWTSDDPYVAERVALMYTHAAKTNKWFEEVTLIVWGPSAKLVAENLKIQEKVRNMQKDGIIIEACIVCADAYEVTDVLGKLGFDVKAMGKPLTGYLKSGAKVLTF